MKNNKTDQLVVKATQWLGIIFLIAVVLWGGWYLWRGLKYEQTNDAQVDAYLSPVNVKVGGYIKKISFQDNQKVHRGDTLLIIQTDEFRLKRDAAAAELMNAKAKLDILNANEETQRRNMDVIRARISGAKAKVQQQQQDYNRYKKLLSEESITRQKFEGAYAALAIHKSDYDETLAVLKAAESRLADLHAERASIAADIKLKEALLSRQELDMDYTIVTAPYDGQLGKKTIQEGQLVQAGQTLAFLTNESTEKWVVANFKETQVGNFKTGQKANIEVDAFPGETFTGVIESLSPTTGSRYSLLPPDNATGNFVKVIQRIPVRIRLTGGREKLNKLSAGMNAQVSILK